MPVHYINSAKLSLSELEQIVSNSLKIALSEDAIKRITHCRQYLDNKIKTHDKPIYGINTGFGSLCSTSISDNDLEKLQENLVKSHACGMGDEVDSSIVKLMMFLKIQALSYGKSAICLDTVEQLIYFYNNDIIPIVYQQGSLGEIGRAHV